MTNTIMVVGAIVLFSILAIIMPVMDYFDAKNYKDSWMKEKQKGAIEDLILNLALLAWMIVTILTIF